MPFILRALPVAALALGLLTGLANSALADDDTALRPVKTFDARYRLKVNGWPGATLRHTLSHEGRHWKSAMRFSIAIAQGQERSRFLADDQTTDSLHYYSGYSLFGVGDSYELADADIRTLDRQTALVDLARRAGRDDCTQSDPCDLTFVDHKGRDENFRYYADSNTTVDATAGTFETIPVVLLDPEKPDREVHINYHADYPGLIVDASYWKDDKRDTHITLTRLND